MTIQARIFYLVLLGLALVACVTPTPQPTINILPLEGTEPVYPYPAGFSDSAISTAYPLDFVTNTPAPTATLSRTLTWEFFSTCGVAPVVYVDPLENGLWTLSAANQPRSTPIWTFAQEKIARQFQWQSIAYFPRFDSWNSIAFLGTDQNKQNWIGLIRWDCRAVTLEILLPVDHPDSAFLEVNFLEEQLQWEYWLVDAKKLTLFHAQNQQGQVIWSTDNVPYSAVYVGTAEDFDQDGTPEHYLQWWDWQGDEQSYRRLTQWIQIYRQETPQFQLIGELDPSWLRIDLESDGKIEFLKPTASDAAEHWDIYAYQSERYGWNGEITLPLPNAAVAVLPDQLPQLPNDLYFTRQNQGWVWPKEGGSLRTVAVRIPVYEIVSPCTGEKFRRESTITWSPDCHYTTSYRPGGIEGTTDVIIDRRTGNEIEVPDSFIYTRGFNSYAWDPLSQYLIYARADGGEGLFRIDLPSGKVSALVPFAAADYPTVFGAVSPYSMQDGSIVFSVQGSTANLFPPLGIYRRMPDGELRRLAALSPGTFDSIGDNFQFDDLYPAPAGTTFLFVERNRASLSQNDPSMLIVDADGKTVWDVSSVLSQGTDFLWLRND